MRYTPISELYRQVRERKLTPQEIEDREKIAKKLPMDDFKKRYGKDAMAVKMATATNIVKKKSAKSEVKEDGHTDVASAIRQCKTVTEDAMQILQKLKSMSPEDSLPSWWTNKLAVASNSMNKLRDYFLVPSVSEEVELDEKAGDENDMKKLVGELQNASKMHLAQSKRVQAHVDMMKGSKDLETIVGELEKASQAHDRQSKTIDAHIKGMSEEVKLDEQFDFVLLDKDNKIVARASGKNAKKEMESSKRSAHLPPMRIPKNEVGKMKIVPISPRDKKDIGDMVLAIGEEVKIDEAPKGTPKPKVEKTKGGFQVMVYSPSSKKYIPQGQPHKNQKDAEKDAKTFEEYSHIKEMIQSGKFTRTEIKKMIERKILEQKSATGYTIFHKSFSDAMQHAYAHAKSKMNMTVDPKEIDSKVATGPKKPGTGKTNRYSLKTNNGILQIQVYNRGGSKPFELNMYSS